MMLNVIFILFSVLVIQGSRGDSRTKPEQVQTDDETDKILLEEKVAAHTAHLLDTFLPADYKVHMRPLLGSRPLIVNVSLFINDISAFSETSMDYKVKEKKVVGMSE